MAALSVIIPTRDRPSTLAHTLARLARQDEVPGGVEVLVVENGVRGAAETIVAGLDLPTSMQATVLFEPQPGPAAARNRAIDVACGELLLFLGDDTAPVSSDFLYGHVAAHAQLSDVPSGVLGLIRWPAGATAFARWLDDGLQFGYSALARGPVAIDRHLYTSNVSLPAAIVRQSGGFDVRFTSAAVEDIEFGWRLGQQGIELAYRPELVVEHDHPTRYRDSLARMERVGAAAAQLRTIQPACDVLAVRRGALKGAVLGVASRVLLRRHEFGSLPSAVRDLRWRIVHLDAFHRAYRKALDVG